MTLSSFALSHYFALALFVAICYGFGRSLTRRVKYNSTLEQVSLSVTLGLGVISYLVLFLGLLGLLYPLLVLIAVAVGLALCLVTRDDWRRNLLLTFRPNRQGTETSGNLRYRLGIALLVLLALVLALPLLILPLYPPIAFAPDATSFHLAAAKMFAQHHGLVFTSNLRYPVFPLTNNMLFTLALLFYDDVFAQLIEFLMLMTLTASVVAFAKHFFSARAAWWSAAILLSNPLVIWLAHVAYVDMAVMLFTTTSTYAFWNWVKSRERAWLVLAAVLCGFGIGTKQTALFFLATFTLTAFFYSFKTRAFTAPILFATIALLVAMPWLARSFYYTHNPVFPAFYETFGQLLGYGYSRPEYYQGLTEAISSSGIGKSFRSLVTLPWQLAFNQAVFVQEASISSIYFYTLPLVLVVGIASARLRWLLALVLTYIMFWFYTVQVLRFLVVIVPLFSLIIAAAIDLAAERLPGLRKVGSYKIITAIAFVALISPGWRYAVAQKLAYGPLPVTKVQRDSFLLSHYASYPAYKLLNDSRGSNYAVYAFQDSAMAYFADGLYLGDWFGPTGYRRFLGSLNNGQELYRELKGLGANYLLIRHQSYDREKLQPPDDEFFNSHFKPIIRDQDLLLFELTEKPFRLTTVEFLQNPGFEDVHNGRPVGWSLSGDPRLITPKPQSLGDSIAVQSSGAGDVLFQRIAVSGGPYLFSCRVRAPKNDQKARLQINWSDTQGGLVKEEIELLDVGSEWKRHEFGLVVPPNAVSVTVYASALNPSIVWFDDFSFGTTAYESLP